MNWKGCENSEKVVGWGKWGGGGGRRISIDWRVSSLSLFLISFQFKFLLNSFQNFFTFISVLMSGFSKLVNRSLLYRNQCLKYCWWQLFPKYAYYCLVHLSYAPNRCLPLSPPHYPITFSKFLVSKLDSVCLLWSNKKRRCKKWLIAVIFKVHPIEFNKKSALQMEKTLKFIRKL